MIPPSQQYAEVEVGHRQREVKGVWAAGRIDRTRVVCSWCGRTIREGREPVQHTICPGCEHDFDRQED